MLFEKLLLVVKDDVIVDRSGVFWIDIGQRSDQLTKAFRYVIDAFFVNCLSIKFNNFVYLDH